MLDLHVHDTDFKYDKHTLPFMEKIDYHAVCKALAEIDYQGDFTYEADNFLARFDASNIEIGVNHMVAIARMLMEKIDAARPQA